MNARDEPGLVRIRKAHVVEFNGAFPGRSTLRGLEDEAGAVIDGNLLGITRDRILDRLERDPQFVAEAGGALQTIEVEFERDKARFEQSGEGGGENLEGQAACRAGTNFE
jgi:hypothetical protein